MDHVVYVDAVAKELERLLDGRKAMIIRGAAGKKLPYGRVHVGENLYFIRNNAEGFIRAKAVVKSVFNSDKMTKEESIALVNKEQEKLQLTNKQMEKWAGKRYLVLIEVEEVQDVEPFGIDKSAYGNMDDWLPVGDIEKIRVRQCCNI